MQLDRLSNSCHQSTPKASCPPLGNHKTKNNSKLSKKQWVIFKESPVFLHQIQKFKLITQVTITKASIRKLTFQILSKILWKMISINWCLLLIMRKINFYKIEIRNEWTKFKKKLKLLMIRLILKINLLKFQVLWLPKELDINNKI